jgi:hypothetical protein
MENVMEVDARPNVAPLGVDVPASMSLAAVPTECGVRGSRSSTRKLRRSLRRKRIGLIKDWFGAVPAARDLARVITKRQAQPFCDTGITDDFRALRPRG